MFFKESPSRGHIYYSVVQTIRKGNDVKHKKILYVGRLDNISIKRKNAIEKEIRMIGDSDLLLQFYKLLSIHGYKEDFIPLTNFEISDVQEYGDILVQHCIWERLGISEIINRIGLRSGGKISLGALVEIQVIHRNCEPGSREKTARWYPKTALPIILKVPISEIYSRILLRSLDYLQPKYTVPMQVEIYNRIKEELGIDPTRVDIDVTAIHFEGNKCIMAKFGYSPPKQQGKKQIVVSVAVDQNGIPLTHIVFPGNRTSKKSLKRIDRILREEFDVKRAVRVGDRGFSTDENIKYMDRNKESYLLALEMNNKEQEIASEAHEQETWTTINDEVKVTELIKHENGRDKKYLIGFDKNRAKDVRKAREEKIKNTEEDLARCQRAIAQGKIKSRKDRDRRIGNILKKNSVGRFIGYQGNRKGHGFRFWRIIENINEAESRDGILVMVTTETRLTAQDMLDSYRERDRIEKAIRVLKDILEIEPQYVYTKEHVLGHVFICILAYQVRSVMRHMLKQDEIDMSIDEAFDELERLKVVNITINGDRAKTYRKLTSTDGSVMALMETFKISKELIELALL